MKRQMAKTKVPCLICGMELINLKSPKGNHPSGGCEFFTHGHYGSGEFDPMNELVTLRINICDQCMKNHRQYGKRVLLAQGKRLTRWKQKKEKS
jgi:hypothetical protein